jgi:hypothetical protein
VRTENKTKALRLEFFKNLYECALNTSREQFASLDKYMRQYRGSTEIDGSDEEALTIRNITYEIVESQISSEIPQPKADAVSYSEKRGRNAETIERLCRAVRDSLPFEELNDIDERYTYIYGGSIWYIDWDNSIEHSSEIGGVRVHCLSPTDFIPQPGIYSIDDMEYCFLRFTTTKGELVRKWGIQPDELSLAECEYEFDTGIPEGDTVTMIVCFYKDEDGEIGRFVFSGELTLSDLPRYYMRKTDVCSVCQKEGGECKCKIPRYRSSEVRYEKLLDDIV